MANRVDLVLWPDRRLLAQVRQYQFVGKLQYKDGVVGWCEGVVYLTSPGRPTEIGLQLDKACYLCSR